LEALLNGGDVAANFSALDLGLQCGDRVLQLGATLLHLVELDLAVKDAGVLAHKDFFEISSALVKFLLEVGDYVVDVVRVEGLEVLSHVDWLLH
jgi:hypothetical protein